jgi:NADH-quinone oxidoreductase subunit L
MAWRAYRNADKGYVEPIAAAAPSLYGALYSKYYVDEGYDYVFTGRRKVGNMRLGVMGAGEASSWFDSHVIDGLVNGAGWITRLSGTLSNWWDKWIIDGLLVNGPAIVARFPFSYAARLVQWGLVQWYALVMVVGLVYFACMMLGLLWWFWLFAGSALSLTIGYFLLRYFMRRFAT